MGWASGSGIFDPVADALIEAGASDELIVKTLVPLIDKLRDEDWDTWDESLTRYRDNPVIVEAFAKAGCEIEPDDE